MTDQTEKLKALAASKIKTWQERMPKPRIAYQCDMNCSPRSEGKDCGDCMPVRVYGDPVAARDAEIADLRADNERLRAEKEAPDLHVIPPTRGTGSQQDADCAALRLVQELSRISMSLAADLVKGADRTFQGNDYLARMSVVDRVVQWRNEWDATRSARDELATRCRVEGGNTSPDASVINYGNPVDNCSGGAAGTDKDAERYRWLRDGSWTNHTHPEIREHLMTCVNRMALDATIDAAIVAGAHTKAGKPA